MRWVFVVPQRAIVLATHAAILLLIWASASRKSVINVVQANAVRAYLAQMDSRHVVHSIRCALTRAVAMALNMVAMPISSASTVNAMIALLLVK